MQATYLKHKLLPGALALSLFVTAAWGKEIPENTNLEDPIPELDCIIEPSDIVDIGSAVPGVVDSILADRSDFVSKGEVLATLESSVEQVALELTQARASLDTAIELRRESAQFGRRTLKRNQELLRKSVISKQDIDQIKSETRIAQLQVRQEEENKRIAELEHLKAKAVLKRRTLRSPVDGVVMNRFKSVGEFVEDEPVLRVARIDPLNVEVVVPVSLLGRIKPGMEAEIILILPGSSSHQATVERVDVVADAASGTYGVRLTLPNRAHAIPAGLRCRLSFLPSIEHEDGATVDSAVLPPAAAVNNTAGKKIKEQTYVAESSKRREEMYTAFSRMDNTESPRLVRTSDNSTTGAETEKAFDMNLDSGDSNQPGTVTAESNTDTIDLPPSCYSIGPIKNRALAHGLAERLRKWAKHLHLSERPGKESTDYIVLSERQVDSSAASRLASRFKSAGISDIYLFRNGPYQNRLSLGLYRTHRFAIKRQQQLSTQGFATSIDRRFRKHNEYWLDVVLESRTELHRELVKAGAPHEKDFPYEPIACTQRLALR